MFCNAVWCYVMLCGLCNAVWCYVCVVGSSLGGCDRLVVVLSGCVYLVAACTMKLNQYSILVIWGEGRCYTVCMWEGVESLAVRMPNVSDSDGRAFALRMYYIEVSNEMSPTIMPKQM